jgi:hypothetical protein
MSEVSDISQPAIEASENTDFDAIANEVNEELLDDEASDDSVEAIDAAAKAGQISKKEAVELKKKFKIKVDGEESEEELDFSDEESVKKHLQKSRAFDKRVKDFSSYKSQVEQMLQLLQTDPEGALEKLGIDVDGLSEKRLSRKIDEMKKSPEQIEREKMEKELEDLRSEKKKLNEAKEQAELEKLRNEAATQIQDDISGALTSAKSILPKNNPLVMQRIAQTMMFAMKNGYPQVTAKDVIPLVEKQWKEEMNQLAASLDDDALEQLVGKANLDKYRKSRIQKKTAVKTETAKQVVKDTGSKKSDSQPKEQVKRNFKDVFDFRK